MVGLLRELTKEIGRIRCRSIIVINERLIGIIKTNKIGVE